MDIDFALVGRRIREARNIRGLTAEVLAERVDLATESLRHIEIGSSKPSLQALYRIASVLGVSMDYLTGRTSSISDSLLGENGLSPKQEEVMRELIDNMLPVITNNL